MKGFKAGISNLCDSNFVQPSGQFQKLSEVFPLTHEAAKNDGEGEGKEGMRKIKRGLGWGQQQKPGRPT